ncbi:MAG TPA: copper resistance protein CopC [Gaiellaceae bacterium]|jgi:copper transport protein
MRRALVIVALAALTFPVVASAHATLKSTTPPFGKELQAAPKTIELHFDQVVKVLPGAIQVLNTKGVNFAAAAQTSGTNVIAPLRTLPTGTYTVRWRAISADSHVTSGVWTFGVRVPAPSVQDAYGAGGPTVAEHIVRWIWFLSFALTIGALGLRLICLRGLAVPRALERRLAVAAGIGVVVSLETGIAAFSLRSEDALQLPLGKFFYGDLSPMAVTPFGRAFIVMTLGFAVVLALIFFAWLLDKTAYLVPAFLISLLLVSGLSLSGHDAVDPGSSRWSELADWVHLAGASLWIGGLGTLAGLVWFGAPELRQVALRRFSQVATVSIALVVAGGVYLGLVRVPHLHDLWTVGYGRVLLVKSGLVLLALAWGGFHKFVIVPRIARGESSGVLTRVGRSLVGEALVGVAVLLLAAILVDSKPPPRPTNPPPTASKAVRP